MKRTNGFSLVELLIVSAIVGVLVGMLLPALQQARESANKAKCASNLRQIGIAMHTYHKRSGFLPIFTDSGTVFTLILPELESQYLLGGTGADLLFLCPSRRQHAVKKMDYATARNSAVYAKASLRTLDSRDGASRCLVLTHKRLKTSLYQASGFTGFSDQAYTLPWPQSWTRYCGWGFDTPTPMLQPPKKDSADTDQETTEFGSAHSRVMPSLYADGHVSNIAYTIDPVVLNQLFDYQDGLPLAHVDE